MKNIEIPFAFFGAGYSPSDVVKFSGVDGTSIRDWRRRDLLRNIGAQNKNHGNWAYSLADILSFAIIKKELEKTDPLPIGKIIGAAYLLQKPALASLIYDVPDRLASLIIERQDGIFFVENVDLTDLPEIEFPINYFIQWKSLRSIFPKTLINLTREFHSKRTGDDLNSYPLEVGE